MAWDAGIDGVHREIAGSTSRRIGVLAGPGTGKTSFGLMRRVVRLLEEGVPGDRILLLSFTRVAAADLRDKVERLQVPGGDGIRATTLHGYCFGLLQKEAVLAATGRVPRVLLDHEVDLMLRDLGDDLGTIHERRRRLEAMTAAWARDVDDIPDARVREDDRDFAHRVERWLRQHDAMLIGEVVPVAYRYLRDNPALAELSAFDHIIVDEYQDLNALEQSLLDVLAGDGALCVAGDDDQSIYSVRYANPEGILTFMQRPEVQPYSIDICGRCPEDILSMANSLISYAPGRSKPALKARTATGIGAVATVQWQHSDEEAEGIAAAVARDIASERRAPGDILILTNWRQLGERVRLRLDELEIPARSFFTQEELANARARESLALLRLVVSRQDAVALRVLLGRGDQSGRSLAYRQLLATSYELGCAPWDVMVRITSGEALGLRVRALEAQFRSARARVEALVELGLEDLVDDLFPAGEPDVEDLRSASVDIVARVATPGELLTELVTTITQDEVPQNPDFVRIMSLHKSKGLTSPCVYIIGAMHGIIPTLKSEEPAVRDAAMQEGRRLFYVAVTRASEELVISSSLGMRVADAHRRQVKYRGQPRRISGELMVQALATPYISELGVDAPVPVTGARWLRSRAVGQEEPR